VKVSEFHFDLPPELIAQHPPAERGASRMLVFDRATGDVRDASFGDLPEVLQPGDLLVLNDSRVLPARLFARRAGLRTHDKSPEPRGVIEVLLTEQLDAADSSTWNALVRPAKKVVPGETLLFDDPASPGGEPVLRAEVISLGCYGERTLRFSPTENFYETVGRIGHMPLPPYIHRDQASAPDSEEDRERYQTVYSQQIGSAAAPTAGLHFTPEILSELEAYGIEVRRITLHVGLGTFQPVRVDRVEDHRVDAESYEIGLAAAAAIDAALADRRRIVAVGTTTTRTLEAVAAAHDGRIAAGAGKTDLFIYPGFVFKAVGALITNFHLPRSSLLMLVAAFAGRDLVLNAYHAAIAERYRFYSYGDAMLIT